ncbi:hypothetical protein CR513_17377, partial [Mucuna pruriens]
MCKFGMLQHILFPPHQLDDVHDLTTKGKENIDWLVQHVVFVDQWNQRHDFICSNILTNNLYMNPNSKYMIDRITTANMTATSITTSAQTSNVPPASMIENIGARKREGRGFEASPSNLTMHKGTSIVVLDTNNVDVSTTSQEITFQCHDPKSFRFNEGIH